MVSTWIDGPIGIVTLGIVSIGGWELLKLVFTATRNILRRRNHLKRFLGWDGVIISSVSVLNDDGRLVVREPDSHVHAVLSRLLPVAPSHEFGGELDLGNPSTHALVIGSSRFNPTAEMVQRHFDLPYEYVFHSSEIDPGKRTLRLVTTNGEALTASRDRIVDQSGTEIDYGMLVHARLRNDKQLLWLSGIHGAATLGILRFLEKEVENITTHRATAPNTAVAWLVRVRYKPAKHEQVRDIEYERLERPQHCSLKSSGKRPIALICDLGNVVLYFDRTRTYRALAHHLGRKYQDVQATIETSGIRKQYEDGTLPDAEFVARLHAVLGTDAQGLPESLAREYWGDIFWPHYEMFAALRRLKQDGLTLLLLSNTNPLHFEYVKRDYPEIVDLFDHVILSYEEHSLKPAKEIYERALSRVGAIGRGSEVLFVDDKEENILQANALGMRSFLFRSYPHFVFWLRKQGVYVP